MFENLARFVRRQSIGGRSARTIRMSALLSIASLVLTAVSPALAQAPLAVLYEQDVTNPSGNRYVGTVVWSTEKAASAPGRKPDIIVHADINIPQKIMVRWSIRHNDDREMPASHLINVQFTTRDLSHGSVASMPGVLAKDEETARGAPLIGAAAKVADNFFLIGLTTVAVDRTRNIELLKQKTWLDLPLLYGDGTRALITFEKGPGGKRAIVDAFAGWGDGR